MTLSPNFPINTDDRTEERGPKSAKSTTLIFFKKIRSLKICKKPNNAKIFQTNYTINFLCLKRYLIKGPQGSLSSKNFFFIKKHIGPFFLGTAQR